MMCEHKNIDTAVNYPTHPDEVQVICLDCERFIGTPIDVICKLRQQLAAANARADLAEAQLEETRNVRNALFISLESANARIAELETGIKEEAEYWIGIFIAVTDDLKNEIAKMRCCGNCVYLSPVHAIAQCGKTGKDVVSRNKCDEWKDWRDDE